MEAPKAEDRLNAKTDCELAVAVRQVIVRDKSLPTYAHSVKIIVKDGSLTLRGPVRSGDERARFADLARQAAGTENVNDQMSIEKSRVTRKKERPDAWNIARTIGARSTVEIIHCCDLCRQLLFGTVLACANGTLR